MNQRTTVLLLLSLSFLGACASEPEQVRLPAAANTCVIEMQDSFLGTFTGQKYEIVAGSTTLATEDTLDAGINRIKSMTAESKCLQQEVPVCRVETSHSFLDGFWQVDEFNIYAGPHHLTTVLSQDEASRWIMKAQSAKLCKNSRISTSQ